MVDSDQQVFNKEFSLCQGSGGNLLLESWRCRSSWGVSGYAVSHLELFLWIRTSRSSIKDCESGDEVSHLEFFLWIWTIRLSIKNCGSGDEVSHFKLLLQKG